MWRRSRARTVLQFRVSGLLEEEHGSVRTLGATPRANRTVLELLDDLEAAARDPSVQAVAIRIGRLRGGWAQVDEVRQAIARLRAKGRGAFAYVEAGGHLEYYLASACQNIVMPPMASLDLVGLRTEVTFFKGAMDLLGVEACFESAGEYKSFAEPFLRESMSEPFRESLNHVLSDLHGRFVVVAASARGLEPQRLQELLDGGPWMAREARDEGLIDRTLYPDRWARAIRKELGDLPASADVEADDEELAVPRGPFARAGKLRFKKASSYLRPWARLAWLERKASSAPRVALLLASGRIEDGDEAESPPGVIAWRALSKAIRAAAEDDNVKAVVLRIDSPGGSGGASDLMWRELRRLAKAKPLVASMGSVAASGGYYLAMAAHQIVVAPMTITGSIGVVGGKFDLEGLLAKAGVTREVLAYGKNTGLFSMTAGLTDDERSRLREHLRAFYDEFVVKAAQGRNMPVEELEPHARGRIWTGAQAVELGLADEVGDLHFALGEAARRAGLSPGWVTRVITPPRPGFLRRIRQRLPFAELGRDADWVQARLPYTLRIK